MPLGIFKITEQNRNRGVRGEFAVRAGIADYMKEQIGPLKREVDENKFPIPVGNYTRDELIKKLDELENKYSDNITEIKNDI